MADLVLDWSLLGAYGTGVSGTTTVETGGVAVNVGFAAVDEGASAFTVNTDNYVAPGEAFDPNSALKLLGLGGEGGTDTTSVTTLDFTASDDAFSDSVQNVSFRLNDIDGGADPDNVAGSHFDKVIIHAYDADGNEVPVVFTPGADVTLGPDRVYSDDPDSYSPTDADASALVSIEGPVARIEIEYANLGDDAERVYVSDVHFSTVPADPIELDGIVEGTADDDVIDVNYTGDPDGDMIDASDAILPGAAPDDDSVFGDVGDDSLYGGAGDDHLSGGDGDDMIEGGAGNDEILSGTGTNELFGGDDRDVFYAGQTDYVDGGEGGDDFDTLDLRGTTETGGSLHVTYETNPENGTVEYFDATDASTGTMAFQNIENVIPCFTPGTTIATPRGERLVEELREGDRIITRDNGIQEIRWVGARQMTGLELARAPHLKPVLIRAGALGNDLPERDMLVSPNHRMLVNNDKAALYFEEREVLAAAKHLIGGAGIQEVNVVSTTYIHFMFDQHEVVLSNGAWTESFQPGDYTLEGIGNAQRNEILELFPELATQEGIKGYHSARRSLKRHEVQLLVR